MRAAFAGLDATYARLRAADLEAAGRWRVATLKAEWLISDGEGEDAEKWEERAERIETQVLGAAAGG